MSVRGNGMDAHVWPNSKCSRVCVLVFAMCLEACRFVVTHVTIYVHSQYAYMCLCKFPWRLHARICVCFEAIKGSGVYRRRGPPRGEPLPRVGGEGGAARRRAAEAAFIRSRVRRWIREECHRLTLRWTRKKRRLLFYQSLKEWDWLSYVA